MRRMTSQAERLLYTDILDSITDLIRNINENDLGNIILS